MRDQHREATRRLAVWGVVLGAALLLAAPALGFRERRPNPPPERTRVLYVPSQACDGTAELVLRIAGKIQLALPGGCTFGPASEMEGAELFCRDPETGALGPALKAVEGPTLTTAVCAGRVF